MFNEHDLTLTLSHRIVYRHDLLRTQDKADATTVTDEDT